MSESVLEVRGLAKSFGGVQAVAGVNLSMPRGEIRALSAMPKYPGWGERSHDRFREFVLSF